MTEGHDPRAPDLPCPTCGRPPQRITHHTIEVTHASIGVLGERLPVQRCSGGHDHVPPAVLAAAREACREMLPVARRRMLRGDTCVSCGAVMTMPGRRTVRAVTVSPPGSDVLTLRFDLPQQRCPVCGLDQLPARAGDHLDDALTTLATAAAEVADGSAS